MQYDRTFKIEAVQLSDEIGIKKASEQLGVPYHTLSGWRKKRDKYGDNAFPGSGYKTRAATPNEQRIRELEKENAELKRSNDILQEALGFFATRRKK